MRPPVPGQLVRPGKSPVAVLALERLVPRVPAGVGPEVGGLGVEAAAAGVRALVHLVVGAVGLGGRVLPARPKDNQKSPSQILYVISHSLTVNATVLFFFLACP